MKLLFPQHGISVVVFSLALLFENLGQYNLVWLILGHWFIGYDIYLDLIEHKRMDSKVDLVLLDGFNYTIWEPNMETLLKRKWL